MSNQLIMGTFIKIFFDLINISQQVNEITHFRLIILFSHFLDV